MKWKDFFYYQERDKRGILLLLILIALVSGLHFFWKKSAAPPPGSLESDSLKTAFEEFQKTLIEDENTKRTEAYEQRKQAYYEQRNNRSYTYNDRNRQPYEKKKYPGSTYQKPEKLSPGQSILINEADTSDWKKVPGIGSGYAKRIVKYRELLGGFVSEEQLKEVYGFSEELFAQVRSYFKTDSHVRKLAVNQLPFEQLRTHPYLNYKQAKTIVDLRQRRGKINSIKTLQLLEEFPEGDIKRLAPYLSFE
jgi:competence ComEA-like helix-hairpin-helix protein